MALFGSYPEHITAADLAHQGIALIRRCGVSGSGTPAGLAFGSIKGSLNEFANTDDNYRAEVEKQQEQAQQGS